MMYHWKIHAFKKKIFQDEGGFRIEDFTEVDVEANSEKEALQRAKEIIKRKYYRVFNVWECNEDHKLNGEMQMLQLKLQAEMLKRLK